MSASRRISLVLRLAAVMVVVLVLLQPSGSNAGAQQPPPITPPALPEAPHPGDLLWTFADEPPFNDARVALAVATLVEQKLEAAGATVYYVERRGPQILAYRSFAPAPRAQVPLLLAAAGFPPAAPGLAAETGGLGRLRETAACQVWSAAAGTNASMTPAQAAAQIVPLLQSSLAGVGLQTQPCRSVQSAALADLLVWVEGRPPPDVPARPGFLALPATQVPPPAAVVPPRTGDAGLAALEQRR